MFRDLYVSVLPKFEAFFENGNFYAKDYQILIYITKEDDIQYSILESVCKDTNAISKNISKALLVDKKGHNWYISGTGCFCSKFDPIEYNEISKFKILELLVDAQHQMKSVELESLIEN